MENYNDWNIFFYDVYNQAYQSYLNGDNSKNFMKKILTNIIRITSSEKGGIIINSNIESLIGYNMDINLELCLRNNLKHSKIIYYNNYPTVNFCCTLIYIPIKFIDYNIGYIFLCNAPQYNEKMFEPLNILSNLLGTLINNYQNYNYSNKFNLLNCNLLEMLDQITESLVVTEINFDIIHINQCARNFIKSFKNNSREEKNLVDYFPKLEQQGHKFYKNNKIRLTAVDLETNYVLDFIINTLSNNNKMINIITIKDVTNEINKKSDIIKNQNNFIAFLSHELRNPLQSIILSSYLLDNKLKGTDDNKIKTQINIINKSSSDMKRIINDIIDLSKIESNEFNLEFDQYEIKNIIYQLYEEYNILANEKKLNFELILNNNIPEKIFTDEVRISQILSNLLSNAIKYTSRGKITFEIYYCREKNGIYFDISDTGMGIKNDELCLLFKEFGLTTNNINCKQMSSGIGLFLSQKMARLLGGYIVCTTKYDEGSTFSFFHPIKLGISGNFISDSHIQYNLKGKILLVDDNESNLILLKMILDNFVLEYNFDLEIEYTSNGFTAIELVKINTYDIIFMDINMIGIDGCTVGKIIRNNSYKGIIIAMTGNIMAKKENQIESCKYDVFSHVIIKPFDDLIILNILNKYLK